MTANKNQELIKKNLGYFTGKTFFDTFIGPKLPEVTESDRKIMERVRRVFQCANKIEEVVKRHSAGFIGNPFAYTFMNVSDERSQELADQFEKLLQTWQRIGIDRKDDSERNPSSPLEKAIEDYLVTGYGYLRLFSPIKYMRSQNKFKQVALHSPDPLSVEIIRDDDGYPELIKYSYYKKEQLYYEVQRVDVETDLTHIWTENQKGDRIPFIDPVTRAEYKEIILDLGGRYTIVEFRRSPLITDTSRRAQDAINYALTLVPSLNEYSGFLLHLILNGLPPGEWRKDDVTQKDVFLAADIVKMSPGSINYIAGLPIYGMDANGLPMSEPSGYTNPSVNTTQPAGIQHLVDSYRLFCSVIYESAGQGHILTNDLQVSGVSRQQQRGDFKISLIKEAATIELILADIFMSAMLMLNRQDISDMGILNIDLKLQTGEILSTDRDAVRNDFTAGLLSRPSAIAQQGYVENPTDEVIAIEEEKQKQMLETAKLAAESANNTNQQ